MRKRYPFERKLTRISLVSSVPMLALLLGLMIYADISIWLIFLTGLLGISLVAYTNHLIYQKLVYKFRSLGNILDAMTHGDYTLRTRSDQNRSELDELVTSLSGLAQRLSQQRWEAVESQLLLHTVIEHIDVAIVALSSDNRISFLNPAAKKLLMLDQEDSNDKLVDQLAFAQSFSSGRHQVVELSLGNQHGRFNVHAEEFREAGTQSKLLFITDVRTLLRSEERKAWQSLVRVISHEINNSLSPIASISQTLSRLVKRNGSCTENSRNLVEGLTLITERANSLKQFVESYKQLAKLPEPKKEMVSILGLVEKICALFKDHSIIVGTEVDVQLFIDPVQIEQVLINLLKNAVEAMSQANLGGVIKVEWHITGAFLRIVVYDQGGGIINPDNLFIPFYSTKKQGSGIGLVLCRQIVEAHNGRLSIGNRTDSRGCRASIEIPLYS